MIATGMDNWNGHYAMALGALNVFYLHDLEFALFHNIPPHFIFEGLAVEK